jgi:hypothetical protein
MLGVEILLDIDSTLDQLICNAEAIQNINIEDLTVDEIIAFEKTQESLLNKLIRMDETLQKQKTDLKKIQKNSSTANILEKKSKFEKLHSNYNQSLQKAKPKASILLKRRTKKLLMQN